MPFIPELADNDLCGIFGSFLPEPVRTKLSSFWSTKLPSFCKSGFSFWWAMFWATSFLVIDLDTGPTAKKFVYIGWYITCVKCNSKPFSKVFYRIPTFVDIFVNLLRFFFTGKECCLICSYSRRKFIWHLPCRVWYCGVR